MRHDRIAKVLGWSVKEAQGLSLLMLRELVRDKDPELARDITRGIKTGEYILEPAPAPALWYAVESHQSTVKRPPRYVVVGSFRASSREDAEATITRRWPYRDLEAKNAQELKDWQDVRRGAVEVYDPHLKHTAEKLSVRGAKKPSGPRPKRPSETYQAAKQRLLNELIALGWEGRPDLKFPWVKHPAYSFRVNFKAQAVYLNEHSLFLDIRGMSVENFAKSIASAASNRGLR